MEPPLHKPKRLEDLPQFTTTSVRELSTDSTGYTEYELRGEFDRIPALSDPRCWLLQPGGGYLIGDLTIVDPNARTAAYLTSEQALPATVGSQFAFLSAHWQAFHVWMVLDPGWPWERRLFKASDAIARPFEAADASIIDGKEVRRWMEIKKADGSSPITRIYPDLNGQASLPTDMIPGGWDHEHCELCKNQIRAGDYGYIDSDGRWMCATCYEKYVLPRDLSFIGEI